MGNGFFHRAPRLKKSLSNWIHEWEDSYGLRDGSHVIIPSTFSTNASFLPYFSNFDSPCFLISNEQTIWWKSNTKQFARKMPVAFHWSNGTKNSLVMENLKRSINLCVGFTNEWLGNFPIFWISNQQWMYRTMSNERDRSNNPNTNNNNTATIAF